MNVLDDESRVRRFVNEIGNRGPKRGLPELFSRFTGEKQPLRKDLLPTALHCLCARGTPWIGALNRSLGRRGKCPRAFRAVVQQVLREAHSSRARSLPQALRDGRVPVGSAELIINRREELGIGKEQHYLLEKINSLYAFSGPIDLRVRFDCDLVYVYGLAMIAAWCSRYAANVTVETSNPSVTKYLERIGFIEVVQGQATVNAPLFDNQNIVALTQILRKRKEDADQIAGRLVNLFANHVELADEFRRALVVTFAELIENVYRHAENDYPGYVMAQAHPAERRLHVVVVDPGIGVFDSFRRSDKPNVRQRATSEAEALGMGIEPYVTSKSKSHSGYGLYVVSSLIEKNNGIFRLTSGGTTLWRRHERGLLQSRVSSSFLRHPRWQGTGLSLMFRLDSPLPLREVYNSLKRDAEDFFD